LPIADNETYFLFGYFQYNALGNTLNENKKLTAATTGKEEINYE
jgi:hypothetical protein